jgi:putative transposase
MRGSDVHRMGCKELRHDQHTVSLLTDHTVFSPKYRGKILVGDVALALEGIIRKICKEMKIEIIDMAVNVDHVHLFIEYPPKYSVSFMAKRIKGRSSRELREAFPHLKEWAGIGLWAPSCFHGFGWSWLGGCARDTYRIRRLQMRNRYIQALYFSAGFGDSLLLQFSCSQRR